MAMDIFSQSRGLVTGLLLGVCITYFLLAISNTIPSKPYDGFTTVANLSDDSNTRSIVLKHTNFTYHGSPLRGVEGVQSRTEIDNSYNQVLDNFDCKKEGISVPKCKQLALLVVLWEASDILGLRNSSHDLFEKIDVPPSRVPRAPHLENCTASVETNKMLDAWGTNGGCADWMLLKNQFLGLKQNADRIEDELADHRCTVKGSYPPWVKGADEDNLPLTRQVQRDIWLHQHPKNCQDPKLRFLLTDWEIDTGFGMGAQFASMTGMLAIALNEGRVLVTNHLNRADHDGCVGSARSHWSCYFFLETSQECRDRALLLASQPNAWNQGLITDKNNYTSRQIWAGKVPKSWGKPWAQMQPTTEIDGKLLLHHKASDRRWWRAQALRYLMRFPSKYTCSLLNIARHRAFGYKAAIMVLESLPIDWPQVAWIRNDTEIEHFVWDAHRPWVPRPLLSIHVRQGDKAGEMKIFYFQSYMALAQKLRNRFPQVRNVWLSTEMQVVIEESKSFTSWDFYFTKITRQVGNMSMPEYEASIGRQVSTDYPLVNFLMAADADFFIGALGSTWCYLIDGMRTTGGKVMAGYLSVNKYRFW